MPSATAVRRRRNKARSGIFPVHIIRDQWRIDHHPPVIELERGYLPDRVDGLVVVRFPEIHHDDFVDDVLFDQHDADLAREGTCGGGVELQGEILQLGCEA
jgi:hypothetical protein